jgi:hypothetical protein
VEETSVPDKKTNYKHSEHTYAQYKECVQDMDTKGNVSSRDTRCQVAKEIDEKDRN